MKQRCNNSNNQKFYLYGGRGISFTPEWENFSAFESWAYKNGYREYLTLDRIDVNKNYEPNNCKWSTYKQQANNTRVNHIATIGSETHTIGQWSDIWGLKYFAARNKIYRMEARGDAVRAHV